MSYTPEMADESYYLRATVIYTDKNRSDRNAQSMSTDAAVTTPADREGQVTLSSQVPAIGAAITATLADADGMVSGQTWQWQKSKDKSSWTNAAGMGAMTMTYMPETADEGYYLRASVSYTDRYRSGRTAESMASGMVVSNNPPAFTDGATVTREVAENSEEGTNVGAPVMATDADTGDTLTYGLSGDDAMYFTIDNMGQIKVGADAMLDYEAEKNEYMVTVTATDDSGAANESASIAVTIMVTDVENELLQAYDANDNGMIEKSEMIAAINDALFGEGDDAITKAQMIEVINLYLYGDDS